MTARRVGTTRWPSARSARRKGVTRVNQWLNPLNGSNLVDVAGQQLGPFANQQVELLCTIPGIQRRGAEAIIVEAGADMTKFPSAGRPAADFRSPTSVSPAARNG